jgi:membrane-bound serine protease (ClpP class)
LELLLPILLIVAGFGLIVAEVYLIPGFNIIGVVGFLLIVFAVGYFYTEAGLLGGTMALAGSVTAGAALFYFLWHSGAWDRFVLATSLRGDQERVAREHEHRARYLGKVGTAVTPLRPTGVAEVEGERIEVVTEGEFIAAGSRVRVVAMDRRRYFARLADSLPEASN